MTRIELMVGLCAAALIGWAAPAGARCISENCIGQQSAPIQPIFIPPVALLQIETAGGPLSLSSIAPPAASGDSGATLTVIGADTPGGLASLTDLDGGAASWSYIAPAAGLDKLPPGPVTDIAAIHAARQKRPLPPRTEIVLAANLSMSVPIVLRPAGVPGIDRTSSLGGNRSLWFAADTRP